MGFWSSSRAIFYGVGTLSQWIQPGSLLPVDFDISSEGDTEEMRTYTVVDGLVGPVVPVIFQDSRGALWFGSEIGGVSRFDGETFESFRVEDGFPPGAIQQILEDRWGYIWFLTQLPTKREGTVSYVNGTNIEEMEENATCMTVDSNGDLWTANKQGLTHYIGVHSSSLSKERAHNEGMKFKPTHHRFSGITDAMVNILFQSKDEKFWIGGSTTGDILLLNFDPDDPDAGFKDFKDEVSDLAKPPSVAIQAIAQGLYGIEYLWFAGRNLLLQSDGKKNHPIFPNPQSTNPSHTQAKNRNDIGLHYDSFHNRIWFSNQGNVIWSDGNNLKTLLQSHEFTGMLRIQETEGDLWFASATGAYRYDPGPWASDPLTTYTVEEGLGSDNIQTIFQAADGKIWFGHDNGVTVFNPQSAFVNFRTRPALGSNSARRIYEDSFRGIWFSIPGGIALYEEGKLHLRKLLLKQDTPQEPQLKPIEIVKIFQHQGWIWLISRPKQTSTETLYTLFAKALKQNKGFKQLTIRVQTETGHGSPPEVLISGPKDPSIAFSGWLFKPDSEGLKWFSPQGIRPFPFQGSTLFEDLPKIKHGPSVIVDMHTGIDGKIWCYREDSSIQFYEYLNTKNILKVVRPVFDLMTQRKPLRLPNPKITSKGSPEETAPKWFFNSEKEQIIYWDTEKLRERAPIEDDFNAPPLAIWESADKKETTFIFSDRLKKYRGTQLIHEDEVRVADVRAALLTDAQVLWLATKQGAVQYNGATDTFKTYGIDDGFLVNDLRDVCEDTIGNIWFATWGGGAVRYDGETFTSVTTKDGLAHNSVSDIHQSSDGSIWFATEGGITRYRPIDDALPSCDITVVEADKNIMAVKADKAYTRIPDTGFAFPSQTNNIAFHFEGIDPLRLRHHLTHEFKLLGLGENDWTRGSAQTSTHLLKDTVTQTFAISTSTCPSTSEGPSVTYQGLKPGNYTFLVKTYRKGWPYTSQPAAVNFTIAAPFWTQWRSYLPYLSLI